ncbi:hypothetical protein FRC01_001056 [Tulasnella sp. 417]|nr:hypothetical protein FRC01_001056 [Tulasnella sp. 417]
MPVLRNVTTDPATDGTIAGGVPPGSPEQMAPRREQINQIGPATPMMSSQEHIQMANFAPPSHVGDDQNSTTPTVDRPADPQNISAIAANSANVQEQEAVRTADGERPPPPDGVSRDTHSPHRGRSSTQGQDMVPHSPSHNNTTSNFQQAPSAETFCSCCQTHVHASTPVPLAQIASGGALPNQHGNHRELGYPPRSEELREAMADAMRIHHDWHVDIERPATGVGGDGPPVYAHNSQINLIIISVGLVMMLLAGVTKLYEAIHPPPS